MCCTGDAAWKREVVPDHKFDFINVPDYHSKSFSIRLQYLWVYILVIKSFLVYMSDIFTAVTMLSTDKWSNSIFDSCTNSNGCVAIPFSIGKWLFVGCIIFGFLLLAYEARKAKKIIASRDISYAFTNVMANNYYSLRSYDHFCFFCHIENSTKRKDDFAFFIFFTFKGWKRLLLADGPRQVINALTLYSFYLAKSPKAGFNIPMYFAGQDLITSAFLVSIIFTVIIFAGSLVLLIAAAILYIPLLCYIQGNLKEYCCHKVDKRIAELMKRKNKQRLQKENLRARKEAAGDFSHLKNKKGELIATPLPQPTLPSVSLDDEYDDNKSLVPRSRGPGSLHYAASVRTNVTDGTYWDNKDYPPPFPGAGAPEYPPMPMYDGLGYPPASTAYSNPYAGSAPELLYDDQYRHPSAVQQQQLAPWQTPQGGYVANVPDLYGPGARMGTPVGGGGGRVGTPVGGPGGRVGTPVGGGGRPPTRDRERVAPPPAPAPPYVDPGARRRSSGLAYDNDDDDAYYSQRGQGQGQVPGGQHPQQQQQDQGGQWRGYGNAY